MPCPEIVFVLSGKRKCGKDYFGELLAKKIGKEICALIRISAPLKKTYAEMHHLDYERLLGTSEYKEKYRESMIKWGEDERRKDPEIFCRLATSSSDVTSKRAWIVTDARRPSDLEYFKTRFGSNAILIRITSSVETRVKRGWNFTEGIDDVESECALDNGINWEYIVENDEVSCTKSPEIIVDLLHKTYIANR